MDPPVSAYPGAFYPGQVYPSQPVDWIALRNWLAAYGPGAPHVTPYDQNRSTWWLHHR